MQEFCRWSAVDEAFLVKSEVKENCPIPTRRTMQYWIPHEKEHEGHWDFVDLKPLFMTFDYENFRQRKSEIKIDDAVRVAWAVDAGGKYKLGDVGSNELPEGTVPVPFEEKELAMEHLKASGIKMRRELQVNEGDGGKSWSVVPPGLSLQVGGDGTAHFNKNPEGKNNGAYALVGKIAGGTLNEGSRLQALRENALAISPSSSKFVVGMKIKADFQGRGIYLEGRILHDHGNGTYDVAYDTGEFEESKRYAEIRSVDLDSYVKKLSEGVKVEAKSWRAKSHIGSFSAATIVRDNHDGTYDVDYNGNNDWAFGVPAKNIRSKEEDPFSFVLKNTAFIEYKFPNIAKCTKAVLVIRYNCTNVDAELFPLRVAVNGASSALVVLENSTAKCDDSRSRQLHYGKCLNNVRAAGCFPSKWPTNLKDMENRVSTIKRVEVGPFDVGPGENLLRISTDFDVDAHFYEFLVRAATPSESSPKGPTTEDNKNTNSGSVAAAAAEADSIRCNCSRSSASSAAAILAKRRSRRAAATART